ncbi:glycoside hydrolase superfamily [Tribonema minus]|uniref:Glycoside hydrolase superfamily n=1 Tax=Tribonema minus TaxID=303371 RepID=A0A836CFE3_9STRA|nr:glycoside hydrolase superfamily [Tribonema minus]
MRTVGLGLALFVCLQAVVHASVSSSVISSQTDPGPVAPYGYGFASDRLVNGGFEVEDPLGWETTCADPSSGRVTGGEVPGGPDSAKSGDWMFYFKAADSCPETIKLSQTITLEPNTPYHVMLYIWLPESTCTTEIASSDCPQLLYRRIDTDEFTGAGVTITAVGDSWNLISGTMWTAGDTNTVELRLQEIPPGAEVWVDDIIMSRCTLEDFRPVSERRVDEIRKRSVELKLGGDFGNGTDVTADISMTKHGYPFGAAMWDGCATDSACLDFFRQNFNFATAKESMKWKESEPAPGVFTDADEKVLNAVKDLDIGLRGHTVFWDVPIQVFMNSRIDARERCAPALCALPQTLPRDGSEGSLQSAMYARLLRFVSRYGDVTANDDVDNEMLHGSFFKVVQDDVRMAVLLQVAPSVHGCERVIAAQQMAYLQPDKRRFLNDFCMMVYCGPDITLSSLVKQSKTFPDANGLGLQSHVTSGKEVCGFDLLARFDHAVAVANDKTSEVPLPQEDLIGLEKKIWVTEMDSQDTDLFWRANAYESFYRAAYASAGVDGMMVWGWARHPGQWRPDQEMVDENFNLLEPGERIFAADGLLHSEWNSTVSDVSIEDTTVSFDAFPGSYSVEVGDCVADFTVPLGIGGLTVEVDAWSCAGGGRKIRLFL